jgi:sugar lactone lactonase YvrE
VTSPSDFASLHPFTLTKGFVPGLNTLDVVVHNDYSVTGLRLDLSGTADQTSSVYLDLNANGSRDLGEPGLAGRVVFLDLNHDGKLDPGDPSAITDAQGDFTLNGAGAGTAPVLEATNQDSYDRYVVDQARTNANGTVSIGVVPFSPVAPVPVVPNPFAASPGTDATTAYVQSLYRAVLGRVGFGTEVTSWVAKINAGRSVQDVATGFVNSPEHRTEQVDAYYEEFLHRAVDPLSVKWTDALSAGASEESVVEGILNSPEYQAANTDPNVFVGNLYLNVLGRDGEWAGESGWVAALASGESRESVVAGFVESVEASNQLVDSFYTAYLRRPDEQGATTPSWVTSLEAPGGSATGVAIGLLTSPEFYKDAMPRNTPVQFQVLVGNYFNNTVEAFSSSGKDLGAFATADLSSPHGIAFDVAGNVYIGNQSGSIVEFTADGHELKTFASGQSMSDGLAFDQSGNLYVANNFTNTVERYSPTGVDLGAFATANLSVPTYIAFDTAGNLYVANYGSGTVEKFSPTGVDLGSFASGLSQPQGLAFDRAANLYVANFGDGTVKEFSSTGKFLDTFISGLSGAEGIAFDPSGNLYVAQATTNTVSVYSPSGASVATFVSASLNFPTGIAIQVTG